MKPLSKSLFISFIILYFIFLGNLHCIQAQNAPVTTLPDISNALPGQQVVVPITVTGFKNIGSFSLSIDYDITKLQFVSGKKNTSFGGVFDVGDNDLGSGKHIVVMGWFGSDANLTDGSSLVNLTFNCLAVSPSLQWFEMGPSCEYTDDMANILNDIPTSAYYRYKQTCTVPPAPGPVTGSAGVCQSSSGLAYSIPPIAGATGYQWTLPSGAGMVSGANTHSITVDYAANAVSGNISVNGVNACGNGPGSLLPVTVNVLPLANAGNDLTIGHGTSTLLQAASGGTGTFSYHWSPEALLVNPDLQNPQTVRLTSSAVFRLEVTNGSGLCKASDEVTVTVSGSPLSASPSVNPGAICKGQQAQLNANVSGGSGVYTCTWTADPPGTPAWSSSLPNPTVNPASTSRYLLAVSDGYNIFSTSTNLTVNQLASALISGGGAVCADGSLVAIRVDLVGSPPWSFTWTNQTATATINNILTTPYFINTADPGLYTISALHDLTCAGTFSGSALVEVKPVPSKPVITLNGAILTSDAASGNQWYKDNQPVPAANGQVYTATENGQYYTIVTINGCVSAVSNRIDLIMPGMEELPDPGPVTGSIAVCQGASGLTYSIAPMTNALGYTWTLPSGASMVSGANTHSITVDFAANAASGNISVCGVNNRGNSPVSLLAITVNHSPSALISGGGAVCADGSQVAIRVDLVGSPPWYFTWANQTATATINNILTTPYFINTSDPGLYTLSALHDLTCPGTFSGSALTEVTPLPLKPTISLNGLTLSSDAMAGNQWYKDNLLIPEATGQSCITSGNGQYHSVVTVNGCFSGLSNRIDLVNTGVDGPAGTSFQLFPNPARDYVLLRFNIPCNAPFHLSVFAANGASMEELKFTPGRALDEWILNTAGLRPGVYMLRINTATSMLSGKLLIR